MKEKLIIMCLIGFLTVFQSCNSSSGKKKLNKKTSFIIGKWEIVQQKCSFLSIVKKNDIIIFKNDGKLLLESKNKKYKDIKITGTWKFKKNKHIKLVFHTDKRGKEFPKQAEIDGKFISSSANTFKINFVCSGAEMLCYITPYLKIMEFKKLK